VLRISASMAWKSSTAAWESASVLQDHLDHGFPARRSACAALAGPVAPHFHDRVEHGAHSQALIGNLAHDAVDQEGAVVLDNLQAIEAHGVAQHRRDPHQRYATSTLFTESPEVGQVGGEVVGGQLRQLVANGVGGDLLGERIRRTLVGWSTDVLDN
jgi:hypothetical protein